MTRYTPGPWFMASRSGDFVRAGSPDGEPVACVYGDPEAKIGPITAANAMLIAAAPDLLEAAKRHVAHCIRCGGNGSYIGREDLWETCELCHDLREAIDKAEGKQ